MAVYFTSWINYHPPWETDQFSPATLWFCYSPLFSCSFLPSGTNPVPLLGTLAYRGRNVLSEKDCLYVNSSCDMHSSLGKQTGILCPGVSKDHLIAGDKNIHYWMILTLYVTQKPKHIPMYIYQCILIEELEV